MCHVFVVFRGNARAWVCAKQTKNRHVFTLTTDGMHKSCGCEGFLSTWWACAADTHQCPLPVGRRRPQLGTLPRSGSDGCVVFFALVNGTLHDLVRAPRSSSSYFSRPRLMFQPSGSIPSLSTPSVGKLCLPAPITEVIGSRIGLAVHSRPASRGCFARCLHMLKPCCNFVLVSRLQPCDRHVVEEEAPQSMPTCEKPSWHDIGCVSRGEFPVVGQRGGRGIHRKSRSHEAARNVDFCPEACCCFSQPSRSPWLSVGCRGTNGYGSCGGQ